MKVYVLVDSVSVVYYGAFSTLEAAQGARDTRVEIDEGLGDFQRPTDRRSGNTKENYTILAVSP